VNAVALMRHCSDADIRLQVRGNCLHVEAPPGAVTPELRQRLADHKAELLALHAIRRRLMALAATLGIPRSVVDALPPEELEATAEQATRCESYLDGVGNPLAQSLLVFYLRELAGRCGPQ
jgi:hypothetical protein